VVSQVKDDPSFSGLSAKDVTKRVMPFVQFRMKEAQRAGKPVGFICQASAWLARNCSASATQWQDTSPCRVDLLDHVPVFAHCRATIVAT
jgi:enhancing lycopene biosynthesis protein 2